MLYISSRSKIDSFTSHRTLCSDRAPDGGVYMPYRIPRFSAAEVNELFKKTFSEIVSEILNLFFTKKLTAWDIDVCAGKLPIKVREVPFRLMIAECFHNPVSEYGFIEKNIYRKLSGSDSLPEPTAWSRIATRIALLFAVFGSIPASARTRLDVSLISDDFTTAMAVWYAREMGLPICTIICSCSEAGTIWDLLQRGELRTAEIGQMEGYIYQRLGVVEVHSCIEKGVCRIDENERLILGEGLYSAVVGSDRIKNVIHNFEKTGQYRLTEEAAVAYAGLQDYRSATGESRSCLILLDNEPSN